MLNKIVIVGDSFMKPDTAYPGQHFSEMLQSLDTVILSQDGSSMGMIVHQIVRGLGHNPDAMIIGFTAQDRMEWPRQTGDKGQWVASGSGAALTAEQQYLDSQWLVQSDHGMNSIMAYAMASGIMSMLCHLGIPFAWTPNLLFADQHDVFFPALQAMMAPFAGRQTTLDMVAHGGFVESPGFHIHDIQWQQRFAADCEKILLRQG